MMDDPRHGLEPEDEEARLRALENLVAELEELRHQSNLRLKLIEEALERIRTRFPFLHEEVPAPDSDADV